MAEQRVRWWAGALVGTLLATGCGGGEAADKTGGETVVLRMATIDGDVNGNGQLYGPAAFVEALEEVSEGTIRVEVETEYGENAADAESRIVEAIAAGDLDGGWPSTRAFAEAGIDGLQAVEAPMTINSYAAESAVATAPVADDLLDQLEGTGIVGLGLTVGPLRRPFATEAALLSPDDWSGTTFRSYNSSIQSAAIDALGGEAANFGTDWTNAAASGELDGAEFDVAQYKYNGLAAEVPFVTSNVVLWPKMFVLSLNQERFDAFTDEQRGHVEAAAQMAVDASVAGDYDDSSVAEDLCDGGVRFFDADAAQLDALHAAVAPVIDAMAADDDTRGILEEIQAISAEHPDVEGIEVSAGCRSVAANEGAIDPEEEPSTLPDGVYRVEITADEVADFGVSNELGWTGTWTYTFEDGMYEVTCSIVDLPAKDCGGSNAPPTAILEAGYLRGGDGPVVYFVGDGDVMAERSGCLLPPSSEFPHCFVLDPYWFDWAVEGDQLTFTNPGGLDAYHLAIEPLTKIG